MKMWRYLSLLLVFAACSAQTASASPLSIAKLGEVLYCLDTKLGPVGDAPSKAKTDSYLVQYFYGVLTPEEEKKNELQLIVYASDGTKANLYRVYFNQTKRNSIYIGDEATVKREDGQMVPDDISGGLGSLEEMQKLLQVTNKQTPIVIPKSLVVKGSDECIYEG